MLTDEQKADAIDKLRMLHGDYPHNHGGNLCRSDGHFAASISREFGMSVSDLETTVGYRKETPDA